MSNCRLLVTMLGLVLSLSTAAAGEKLAALRSASRRPRESHRSSPPLAANPELQEEDLEAPNRSKSKAGKLAAVAAAVRGGRAAPSRQPRPTPDRPLDRHHPRRPINSDRAHSHIHSAPIFPSAIIEEHIYCPSAVIVDVPCTPPPRSPLPVTCVGPTVDPAPVVGEFPPETAPLCDVLAESLFPSCDESGEQLPPWHVRFGIDYASDDDVSRQGFDLLANATGGLGIDSGLRLFREPGVEFRDHLWIGDFNVVYEIIPTQWVRPRIGAGLNWLVDGFGAEAGLNLTLGADLLVGPVTLTGETDFGALGDADLIHWRLTAGLRQGRHVEWFGGYDHLDIGGVEVRGVVGGLRFRF